jgi:CxxC motif-containing protein (DUF1111 family)
MQKLALAMALAASVATAMAACDSSSDDGVAAAPAPAADAPAAAPLDAELVSLISAHAASTAKDPGPRAAAAGTGVALKGLTPSELSAFNLSKEDFIGAEDVEGGLGPTMNLDSCGGCHAHPATGGTSPTVNPEVAFATLNGAKNVLPPFVTRNGPALVPRFVRNADGSPDGTPHPLFTITGRADAPGCSLAQPDFAAAIAAKNIVFRIPLQLFGNGLVEQITDQEILASQAASAAARQALGIKGHPNRNATDGTIGRFGWKAQQVSLLTFAGGAYNVEMGITSLQFPVEREQDPACQLAPTPNDIGDLNAASAFEGQASPDKFAIFMRFLAPAVPSANTPGGAASIKNGKALFESTGCTLCHTPTLHTAKATVAALRKQDVNLFSDLMLHNMGDDLADGVAQGEASGREFRTTPLWGVGQRLFLLHDGRTSDISKAVLAHASAGSEANEPVRKFLRLSDTEEQDLLNFLRSL